MLFQCKRGSVTAGFVDANGRISRAAPILRRYCPVNRSTQDALRHLIRDGWGLEKVESEEVQGIFGSVPVHWTTEHDKTPC